MTAGRTKRTGRYRATRKRRANTAALIGLAAAIAVTFLLALGARAMVSGGTCGSPPVTLNVLASAQIEPTVQRIGRAFNAMRREAGGRCVVVSVRPASPAAVLAQLTRTGPGRSPRVDAWIPDSGLWPELAPVVGATARIRPTGITVARSALVIVMPRQVAARMAAFGTSVSWKFLLPQGAGGPPDALGLQVRFPDPAQSGTGLAALSALQRISGQGAAGQGAGVEANVASLALHVQVVPVSAGLAALAVPPPGPAAALWAPVTITTEQQVIQFDRAHPKQPLAVRYPAEGSEELSYPYLLTTTDPLRRQAAEQFGRQLRSGYAAAYLRYAGFRSGDGAAGTWPAWYGLTTNSPTLLTMPAITTTSASLRAWQQVSLGSRDLILADTSAAMTAHLTQGGPDLAHVLAQAAGPGLAQFPGGTQMGLWAFPSRVNDGLFYQQDIPVGPLRDPAGALTRRQQITSMIQSTRPQLGSPAPLYGAILAAYRDMLATYQPRYANTVVVLTAGVDRAPDDISATALLGDLHVLYDPAHPVMIMVIILGQGGDVPALRQIAAATGGQAVAVLRPGELGTAIYQSVTRELCPPRCLN